MYGLVRYEWLGMQAKRYLPELQVKLGRRCVILCADYLELQAPKPQLSEAISYAEGEDRGRFVT